MINIPTRIAIGITALAIVLIVLASISFADNQVRKEDIKLTQNHLARQMDIWEGSKMYFRYHAMELKLKYYDEYYEVSQERITILEGKVIVEALAKVYAYEEIGKLAFFIKTLTQICEANGITVPIYITRGEVRDAN